MGFDGQGRFHIRLTMAEGFTGDGLLAVPYDAGNEQMGSTLERIAVDGGMDCVVGGITPADAADMAYIRVYGTYRGPEAPIEGTWSLPVALEPAEARTLTLERELGNFRVGLVELSPSAWPSPTTGSMASPDFSPPSRSPGRTAPRRRWR